MAYLYTRNADGELVHNRLNSVNNMGNAAGMPTGTSAYTYDRDGRLARDVRENLRLRWTVDNKLRGATNGNREVRYWYDATGQRVMKRLHGDTVEYIVRDGGGNELERVTRRNNTTSPILIKAEANLMGSGRLGIHELPATATADTMEQRASGRSQYELSDHLGNVRTTVGDVKAFTAINASSYRLDGVVRSANDHYPYGMPMNSRSFAAANTYRFGFNTQEKSLELNSGGNFTTALFWEYDSRTGRRWNLDPVVKPSKSGYHAFSNKPILNTDPNGDNDDEFDRNGNKISDLGGTKVNFYHQKNGDTKIEDQTTCSTNTITGGEKLIRGYTQRNTNTSWADIFNEWDQGTGPTKSIFTDFTGTSTSGPFESLHSSFSSYTSLAREDELKSNTSKNIIKMDYGNANPFVANDMWEQMLGRTNISWYKLGDKTLFMMADSKSMTSFAYRALPSWERSSFKLNGNTYQTYIWIETNKAIEFKVEEKNQYWNQQYQKILQESKKMLPGKI